MKRVVALDILLKPRPADTEQGEGGEETTIRTVKHRTKPDAALLITVAGELNR